ncbi:MAG: VWA domain-containing protein [bacterium]|nr:VWA domain-containing protein [bacterium]
MTALTSSRAHSFAGWLAALFLLVALPSLALADDEIVKEFKKYFRKYKETATRVEAILALEDAESTAVVDVLLPILKDEDAQVVDAAVRVLGGFESRPPIDRMLEKLESEKNELIRVGTLRSLGKGGYSGTTDAVSVCLEDKSWDVRRRAVQALASTGDAALAERLVPLAADKEPAVRSAVMQGLSDLRSDLVREPAMAALADGVWQVRASAINALGRVRHKDSIAPLLARMKLEEGRLVGDIAGALESITGRGFGQRIQLWENFWNTYKDRYVIPTDAELKALREKQRARKAEYTPEGQANFVGIDTPSRSILFVIDVSGSMENEIVDKASFRDGGYPSFSRMDIVKTELARTVENLEAYVKFNILSFATDTKAWKKKLVSANVLNKSSALTFCKRLEPIGGASKEDMARVGLVGAANLSAGKTNTFGALAWALEVAAGRGAKDKHYKVAVDTIFFLSDGRPTHGEFVDIDDILREVREANELRKVVIHTIAIGEFQKTFMERLAAENGGVFVDLGR